MVEGELEIGQVAGLLNKILPVAEIMDRMISEYNIALDELSKL